jgi:hypothetical protein
VLRPILKYDLLMEQSSNWNFVLIIDHFPKRGEARSSRFQALAENSRRWRTDISKHFDRDKSRFGRRFRTLEHTPSLLERTPREMETGAILDLD